MRCYVNGIEPNPHISLGNIRAERSRISRTQKLLIVTRHTPLPWEDGAGAYLHDLARFLARHEFRVDILWLKPHEHLRWGKVWRLPKMFDRAVHMHLPESIRLGRSFVFPSVVWLPFKANLFHWIRRALKPMRLDPPRRRQSTAQGPVNQTQTWMSPPSATELEAVQRFSAQRRPDIVVASYAWMCPILDLPALRGAQKVCLAHDVAWRRAELSIPSQTQCAEPEVSRESEAAWLGRAGIIAAISESDAEEIRILAPAARVAVAPKAVETHGRIGEDNSHRLLFVGSENAFNTEGLKWFLCEVWPIVKRETPAATLDVCGTVERSFTTRTEGVAFHGQVPSLDAYYRRAAIVIVPLLRATGLNIKLVDAAAFGRAIVTTRVTLAGAPFLRGSVAVADSPADFVAAVRRLLADPVERSKAADRARAAVRTRLAPSACYGPLAALLKGLPSGVAVTAAPCARP
jgi:glycosyltransferase involved in cell wall biosynthesis